MAIEDRHPQLKAKFRELKAKKRRLVEHQRTTHHNHGDPEDWMGWHQLVEVHARAAERDGCAFDPAAPLPA